MESLKVLMFACCATCCVLGGGLFYSKDKRPSAIIHENWMCICILGLLMAGIFMLWYMIKHT
jgi:hypothetical protein